MTAKKEFPKRVWQTSDKQVFTLLEDAENTEMQLLLQHRFQTDCPVYLPGYSAKTLAEWLVAKFDISEKDIPEETFQELVDKIAINSEDDPSIVE